MEKFSWYRELVGGIWARIDYSSNGEGHWVQMTKLDFLYEDYFTNRLLEIENYTGETLDG